MFHFSGRRDAMCVCVSYQESECNNGKWGGDVGSFLIEIVLGFFDKNIC